MRRTKANHPWGDNEWPALWSYPVPQIDPNIGVLYNYCERPVGRDMKSFYTWSLVYYNMETKEVQFDVLVRDREFESHALAKEDAIYVCRLLGMELGVKHELIKSEENGKH